MKSHILRALFVAPVMISASSLSFSYNGNLIASVEQSPTVPPAAQTNTGVNLATTGKTVFTDLRTPVVPALKIEFSGNYPVGNFSNPAHYATQAGTASISISPDGNIYAYRCPPTLESRDVIHTNQNVENYLANTLSPISSRVMIWFTDPNGIKQFGLFPSPNREFPKTTVTPLVGGASSYDVAWWSTWVTL